MDYRWMIGAVIALAAGIVASFAVVHSREAGGRAREAERRLAELEGRLKAPEAGAPAHAGQTDLGPRVGELERKVDELTRGSSPAGSPPGATGGPAGNPPGDATGRPPSDAAAAAERAAKIWKSLGVEDRGAMIALVKEAQKQIRQEEVWGWAAGIQASFVKSLREKLQLTPGQEERVSSVLKVYLPEMNKVWHSEEGTPEERAEKSKELWAKVDGEVGPTLTGEQALAYEAWRKEQAEKAKKHADSGGK
jgi:hypothetical protein